MKIKSLEIIGFKSFGDRTILHFDRQIAGIVGPNGCGKSNIVDAIRWVMGEQSAKGLRGTEMSDVIFNGTTSRKKGAFAEVSMTFDNTDKLASAPYTDCVEIMITRRLYRSGESEYLINKVAVRLKDINDLFLGTGSSARAYSIVAQGKVDQIVLAKPEDRRFLLEEAAGVAKYKARKLAAERKMEATRANLERAHDIIRELERNGKYLERQVDRAEQFRKIQSELRRLDEQVIAFKVTKLDRDAESSERRRTDARILFESTSTEFAKLEAEIERLRFEALNFEKLSSSDYERLIQLKENFSFLDKEIELGNQRIGSLQNQIEERKKDIERIRSKAEAHDLTIQQVLEARTQMKAEWEQKKASIEQKRAELQAQEEIIKTLEAKIDADETEFDKKQTEAAKQAQKREMLAAERVNLELTRAEFEIELERIDLVAKQLNTQGIEKLGLSEQGASEIQTFESRLTELRADEQRIDQVLSAAVLQRTQLQDQISFAEAQLKSLIALEEREIGYDRGALNRKKRTGKSLLLEQIKFKAGAEKVAEGFLATFGQVFLDEPIEGENGDEPRWSYLKEVAANAAFDQASSLLQYVEGDVSPQLQSFLAGIQVVDSIDEAGSAQNLLIDRSGKLSWPAANGFALLSRGSLEKEQTPFGRQAEIEKFRAQKQSLTAELQTLDAEIESLKIQLKTAKSSAETCRQDIQRKGKALGDLKAEVARIESQKEAQVEKYTRCESEIRDIDVKITSIATQLKELVQTQDLEELKARLAASTAELTQLKSQKASADNLWIEERIAFGAVQEKLDRLEQQSVHVEMTKSEYSHNQSIYQTDIENWASEVTREEEKIANHRLAKQADEGKIRELEIGLAENREALSKIRSELEQLEASRKTSQSAKEEAQKNLQELELDHQRLKFEVEELSQLVEVRYHISLQEVLQQVTTADLERLEDSTVLGALEVEAKELREKVENFGEVNLLALTEFEDIKKRLDFMHKQQEDLLKTLDSLQSIIERINKVTEFRFRETFKAINHNFQILFPKLFGGGRAFMTLTNEQDLLETGVEIFAEPPGKKVQVMSLLSGGEKAMTSISLLFALFAYRPASFCILDEVDAPLDEINTTRYNSIIQEMAHLSQFIVITHNKRTMEVADKLFGVTMQEPGVSQIIGVELQEAKAFVA